MGTIIVLAFQPSPPTPAHAIQIHSISFSEGKRDKWQSDLGLWEEAGFPFAAGQQHYSAITVEVQNYLWNGILLNRFQILLYKYKILQGKEETERC